MLSNWLFFFVCFIGTARKMRFATLWDQSRIGCSNDYIAESNGLAAAVLSLYSKLKVALEQGRNLTASLSQRR